MKDIQQPNSPLRSRPLLGILAITLATAFIAPATTAFAADGAAVYAKKCKACHGTDGTGNTKMGKKLKCRNLSDPAVQKKLTDSQIAKAITEGVKEGSKVRMKAIKGLSDADVQAVVKYVRTLTK